MPPESEDSEIASRGIDIHEALVTDDDSKLTLADKTVKDKLRGIEVEALKDWLASHQLSPGDVTILREVRLWIRDRNTLEPWASAKVDFAAISEKFHLALIIDAKSGFLDTTPAELNWQLRVQAVALDHEYNYSMKEITCAISWGRGKGKFDPVIYDYNSLMWAEQQIQFFSRTSQDPDAPRIPGHWCRYCRVKGKCREYTAFSMTPVMRFSIDQAVPLTAKKEEIAKRVDLMSPEAMAWAFLRKGFANNFFEAVTDRLKGMLKDELAEIGLELKPNAPMRQIKDVQIAYTALKQRGLVNDDEFRSLCKLGIGVVEEMIVPRLKAKMEDAGPVIVTEAAAIEELNRILSPAIEMKDKSPSLKPIKSNK